MEWLVLGVVLLALAAFMTSLRLRNRRAVPQIPDTPDELFEAFARSDQGPGELFGDPAGARFPGPGARRWAYGVLWEAGVDADADPAYAASLLVRAQPRLTKPEADALIRALL